MRTLVLNGFIGESKNRSLVHYEPINLYQENPTNVRITILDYQARMVTLHVGASIYWAMYDRSTGDLVLEKTGEDITREDNVFSFHLSADETTGLTNTYYHEARLDNYTLFVGTVNFCSIDLLLEPIQAPAPS